jgi:hypothetical protein
MNDAATPIRKLTATQSAWLEANGIETWTDSSIQGIGFYCPRNESSLSFYDVRHPGWDLEERDYCENGDGSRFVKSYPTLKAALKALIAHEQTSCGCCAA